MNGLDTPNVRRHPLAVGQTRYAGEWVVAVVAETRALAEDATEKVRVIYEPLPFVISAEEALKPDSPPVHAAHGSNVLLDHTFVWGEVDKHFAESPRHLSFRVTWGRSSTVPIETFGVAASWDPWRDMLDVWASIQMPKYPDQIARALRIPANNVRVHQDVDVGGSYGVKRGIKQTVLVAHLARRLGRPVRLIEDRLENMRGGDAHGPERIFDVDVAFNDDGIVKSMKIRALDNAGAYAGRAPFQLGKPIGAIVGPYQIESVQYRAQSVTSNKAVQEAVRGFGQAPTNYAIETAIDKVAAATGLARIEVRRRNFIRKDEFPYLIPSGSTYDSGDYHTVVDKVFAHIDFESHGAGARPAARLRPAGRHRHRGVPGTVRRQFLVRAAAQRKEHHHHLDGFLPHRHRCARLRHGDDPQHLVGAGPRDAGVDGRRRSPADRSRPDPRDPAGLAGLPAVQFAGRQPHGDHARRRGVPCRAEAEDKTDTDRRASIWHCRGQGRLRQWRCRDGRQQAQLDRTRHHRPPPVIICCPRAWSPASKARM